MAEVMWSPGSDRAGRSRMAEFMRLAAGRRGFPTETYDDLYRWSIAEPQRFWAAVWDFCGVEGVRGERILLDGTKMPGARWFPDARLNFAANLLRRRDAAPAIVFRREDGLRRETSFAELHAQVARLQVALRRAGLRPGDRAAGFMPNLPEAVAAMLAVTGLGGIWSSCSPDFGPQAVQERYGQIEPKILFAADGYPFRGRSFDGMEKLRVILRGLPSVERTVVVPYLCEAPDLSDLRGAEDWRAFEAITTSTPARFDAFPFDHPLYILFSSGTTGKPKCIVHGAGGTLLQHLKEHQLHTDLRETDRLFYYTTTGWMMWNWLVSGLATGATIVLFDGHPFHPRPEALMEVVAEERVTVFGTSAKYLDSLRKAGAALAQEVPLPALRAVLSTGSPLAPEGFDYVYRKVKPDVLLASISGGTDIASCFALGCPILPVRRGELQCRGLGMSVEVYDEGGRSVTGVAGELVCTAPFPSMPVGFWNDPDGSRYRSAYFERFPGVWRHGDWAEITPTGGVVIHGRSDATLNPGGVRIGTAEITRQVELVEEVEESVVVGQAWQGDQRIVLFVRIREGHSLTPELADTIRRRVRENVTPRHVPARILQVADIPRTLSGKISELTVGDVIHGRPVRNTEALANPESLEQFRDRAELRT